MVLYDCNQFNLDYVIVIYVLETTLINDKQFLILTAYILDKYIRQVVFETTQSSESLENDLILVNPYLKTS